MRKINFKIDGMHCNSCATLIEEELKELEGIKKVSVSFASEKALVEFDEGKISEKEIFDLIHRKGYEAKK